jgi:glycosyltransferase involved in cell wall biosynthesis
VHIFEPFAGRHHTKYVALLLPTLVRLRSAGAISRIVVSTSQMHLDSTYFADRLAQFHGEVEFDVLGGDFHNVSGSHVTAALLDSVRRIRPTFVISTSANNGAFSLAQRSLYGSPFRAHGIVSAGVIHNGFAKPATGLKDRMRDAVHRFSRRFAPWSGLYVVNPILYGSLLRPGKTRGLRLLPDPVEVLPALDKKTARERLGIPVDGRYVGHVGQSDDRKAVPELLAAFRDAGLQQTDRLLIAGIQHPPYRALIDREYGDLVEQQRLVVLDRYLDSDELHAANCASDVIAITYYTDELSGNLLAATAARRPVIASLRGYTGMMIETFGVGWGCDIFDPPDFARGLREAVASGPGYELSPAAEELLRYHDPQNYANSLLALLYPAIGLTPPDVKPWQWTTQATA